MKKILFLAVIATMAIAVGGWFSPQTGLKLGWFSTQTGLKPIGGGRPTFYAASCPETYPGVDFTSGSFVITTNSDRAHYIDEATFAYVPGAISLLAGGDTSNVLLLEQSEADLGTAQSVSDELTGYEFASGDSLYITANIIFEDESDTTVVYAHLVDHGTSLKWRLYVDPWGDAATHIVPADTLSAWSVSDATIVQPNDTDDFWCGTYTNQVNSAIATGYNSGMFYATCTLTYPDYTNYSRRAYVGWNLDDLRGKRVLFSRLSVRWSDSVGMSNSASQQTYAIIDTLAADSLRVSASGNHTGYATEYFRSNSFKWMSEADGDSTSADGNVAWAPALGLRDDDVDFGLICPLPLDKDISANEIVSFPMTGGLNTALNIGYGPQAFWIHATKRGPTAYSWFIGDDGATYVDRGPVLTVAYIEEETPPDPYLAYGKFGDPPRWTDTHYDRVAQGGIFLTQALDLWDEDTYNPGVIDSLRSRNADIKIVAYTDFLFARANRLRTFTSNRGTLWGDMTAVMSRHLAMTVDDDTMLWWEEDFGDGPSDDDHWLLDYVSCPTLADSLAIVLKSYIDASSNDETGITIYIDEADFPKMSAMYADTGATRWGSNDAGKLLWRGAADLDGDGVPHDIDEDEQAALLAAMTAIPGRIRAILGDDVGVVMNGIASLQHSAIRAVTNGVCYDGYPGIWGVAADAGATYLPYNRSMDMRVDAPDSTWYTATSTAAWALQWPPITEGIYEMQSQVIPGNVSIMLPRMTVATDRRYHPAGTIIARMFQEIGCGPYVTYMGDASSDQGSGGGYYIDPPSIWRADFGDPVGPIVCSDPDGKMETGDTLTREFERGTLVITQSDGTLASPFTWSFTWR